MAKGIAWLNIKIDYLQGITPKELAEKYNVDIDKLYKKIENEKWASELREIKGNIGNEVQEQIADITKLALSRLKDVLSNKEVRTGDLVNAIGKAFDVSGLKSSKQEITGNVGVEKIYITAEENKQVQDHIDDFIEG